MGNGETLSRSADVMARLTRRLRFMVKEEIRSSHLIERRQAIVDAVNYDTVPSVDLRIGGSSTIVPDVRFLNSYSPVLGDTVWVDNLQGDLLVVGKVENNEGGVQPIGAVEMYAGAVLPGGWLWCDGTEYDSANYPGLYSVLGTTFGSSGAGLFQVPDLRGRAPIGVGTGSGLTARDLGDEVGDEAHDHGAGDQYVQFYLDADETEVRHIGSRPSWTPTNRQTGVTWAGGSGNSRTSGLDVLGTTGSESSMQPSLALNFIIRAA